MSGIFQLICVQVLLLVSLSWINHVESVAVWSYDGGPTSWPDDYPDCGGENQSPIDISSTSNARRPPLGQWNNYNVTPASMTISNDGKTVLLSSTSASGLIPTIRNHKRRQYQLDHVEIHFGKTDSRGSEHTIDGKSYPMELYAVHLKVKNGVIVTPNEYLITSTLYQLSTTANTRLAQITGYLQYLILPYESFEIPPFTWSSLLSPFTTKYYTYKGSLTAPPCTESAIYFINQIAEPISANQLALFRALQNGSNRPMGGNFRPLQPRNNRNIFRAD